MAFFNEFPRARTYDDDLGWLIRTVRKLIDSVDSVSEIKYADPINWSIASQYEKNTIVKDEESGVLYLSKQPVPAGIPLTNEDYWLTIGNFDYQITFLRDAISAKDEGNSIYSQREYTKNEMIWWNEKLFLVLENINQGDELIEGTNVKEITLDSYMSAFDSYMSAFDSHMSALQQKIEDLTPKDWGTRLMLFCDALNGSNDNDGLTKETAMKDIMYAYKWAILHGYTDVNIALRDGDYYMDDNRYSNITCHIYNNENSDATIHFTASTNYLYNSYFHFEGSNNHPLVIDVGSAGLHTDAAAVFCRYVKFISDYDVDLDFSTSFVAWADTIEIDKHLRIRIRTSVVTFSGVIICNWIQNSNRNFLSAQGSMVSIISTITLQSEDAPHVTYFMEFQSCHAHCAFSYANFSTSNLFPESPVRLRQTIFFISSSAYSQLIARSASGSVGGAYSIIKSSSNVAQM